MIYEADKGSTVELSAREALKLGCAKFVHNGRIFLIKMEFIHVGNVQEINEPAYADKTT